MENAIFFGSPGCGACKQQEELLRKNLKGKINYVNVDRFPDRFKFLKVTPTWVFPQGNNTYRIHEGLLNPETFSAFGKRRGRKTRFGKENVPLYPNINDLAVYGKTFPNNKGFEIPPSFYKTVENVWGTGDNTLNAGVGGSRSLGPDNISEMYSNGYFNNIRMAHPSDQLGTALYLNKACNINRNISTVKESPGMIFDSNNPQTVSMTTGFGRKRRGKRNARFGGDLYNQMGPAYEIGNQYLINKDTGKQLFSGARQDEYSRPYSVNNKYTYIGQAAKYNPIGNSQSFPSFGKKKKNLSVKTKKRNCIGEGTTLKIKNGKLKTKN